MKKSEKLKTWGADLIDF